LEPIVALPPARDLFSNADGPLAIAQRFEDYKSELNKSLDNPVPAGMTDDERLVRKAVDDMRARKGDGEFLSKAVTSELISSVSRELANSRGFLGKDIDLSGPGSTGGLHAYSLEAPAKVLVPRKTPLRNRIPRTRMVGVAHEYKRITGFSNAGVGGVPNIHPGLSETATTTFGSLNLRRGAKIQYAGDDIVVPAKSFSLSDEVTMYAQNAAMGFEDLRQLSTTSTLYACMLAEERLMLSGRGTAPGFGGVVATPAAPTVLTPAASGSQTAVTGVSTSAWAYVAATTMWGTTALSAVGTSTISTGDVVTVTWTPVSGAESYSVLLGGGSSAPALTATYLVGTTSGNSLTVQGALPTGAAAASTVDATAHPTAQVDSYDGILAILTNPDLSGSITNVNGPLTTDAPFQDAFSNMYDQNQADPETLYMNGHDRSTLSTILTDQSSASYRIMVNSTAAGNSAPIGALITGIQNSVTGTVLDLETHPFLPRGLAPFLSWNLPIPDSQVSELWASVNVVDYQAYQWPAVEFAWQQSVLWTGTFCSYGPAWSGIVTGITAS
jgi:hypothetical protein